MNHQDDEIEKMLESGNLDWDKLKKVLDEAQEANDKYEGKEPKDQKAGGKAPGAGDGGGGGQGTGQQGGGGPRVKLIPQNQPSTPLLEMVLMIGIPAFLIGAIH